MNLFIVIMLSSAVVSIARLNAHDYEEESEKGKDYRPYDHVLGDIDSYLSKHLDHWSKLSEVLHQKEESNRYDRSLKNLPSANVNFINQFWFVIGIVVDSVKL